MWFRFGLDVLYASLFPTAALSEIGLSRTRFVFRACASGLGITLSARGPLVFPAVSHLLRTRFTCRLFYRSS